MPRPIFLVQIMAKKSEYLPGDYARCSGQMPAEPCLSCLRRVAPWTSNEIRLLSSFSPALNFDGSCEYFIPADKEKK